MLRAVAIAMSWLLLAGTADAGQVELLSVVDPLTPAGTVDAAAPDVSADGRYVAFLSASPNVLSGQVDTNNGGDVFVRDRVANSTVLVSRADGGGLAAAANAPSEAPALSADGRYVAFLSRATNLVAGQLDLPGTTDVFLHDRVANLTVLVSHVAGLGTTAAGGLPAHLDVSADGRWVVYTSLAITLVPLQVDVPLTRDVFVWDRVTDTTALASHTFLGSGIAAGGCQDAAMSADGGWIAFSSSALAVVLGVTDLNLAPDLFLYDRGTGAVSLASHTAASASVAANGASDRAALSGDGSWIAFASTATDLVAGSDGNGGADVFLHRRGTGANTLVTHTYDSFTTAAAGSSSGVPLLSGDGQKVAFESNASNLLPNLELETSDLGFTDVYLYDRASGANRLVSHAHGTPVDQPDGHSFAPSMSADGTRIAFLSLGTNFRPGQDDGGVDADVFLFELATGEVRLVSHELGSATDAGDLSSGAPRISADGSRIAFLSQADDLVAGVIDPAPTWDLFLHEVASAANAQLSLREGAPSVSVSAWLEAPAATAMSNDGRYLAFTSDAANVVPGQADSNLTFDVFLRDRLTGTAELVSRAGAPGTAGSGASIRPLVTTDGSSVLFLSRAQNLVPGQASHAEWSLFHFRRADQAVVLVSHADGSPADTGDADVSGFAASGSGRWVAYATAATNLLPDAVGGAFSQIYLYDRESGQTTLVSHVPADPAAAGGGDSYRPDVSSDGRWIAFASNATDLVGGPALGGLFLYDRTVGTVARIAASGDFPRISADGRWVAFTSPATNVVPGQVDANGGPDVFLWERATGTTLLASRTSASALTAGNGASAWSFDLSYQPVPQAVSADGRFVAFLSQATNLVAGQSDGNSGPDAFLFDRAAGTTRLVSHAAGSAATAGDGVSSSVALSANGGRVAFASLGTNHVVGQVDTNGAKDVFLYNRTSGAIEVASRSPLLPLQTANGSSASEITLPRISADGRVVAFASDADDLVAGDFDVRTSVFAYVATDPGLDFYTLTLCRLIDTRVAGQGPALTSGEVRPIQVTGLCGIPATARAVALNVTVVGSTSNGSLTLFPADLALPSTSTISFQTANNRANNGILALAIDGTGSLSLSPIVAGGGTVHAIVDVTGWFE